MSSSNKDTQLIWEAYLLSEMPRGQAPKKFTTNQGDMTYDQMIQSYLNAHKDVEQPVAKDVINYAKNRLGVTFSSFAAAKSGINDKIVKRRGNRRLAKSYGGVKLGEFLPMIFDLVEDDDPDKLNPEITSSQAALEALLAASESLLQEVEVDDQQRSSIKNYIRNRLEEAGFAVDRGEQKNRIPWGEIVWGQDADGYDIKKSRLITIVKLGYLDGLIDFWQNEYKGGGWREAVQIWFKRTGLEEQLIKNGYDPNNTDINYRGHPYNNLAYGLGKAFKDNEKDIGTSFGQADPIEQSQRKQNFDKSPNQDPASAFRKKGSGDANPHGNQLTYQPVSVN